MPNVKNPSIRDLAPSKDAKGGKKSDRKSGNAFGGSAGDCVGGKGGGRRKRRN